MGGMVAQLLYRRHPSLLSGLVLCSTACNVSDSPMRYVIRVALATLGASVGWNPTVRLTGAETLGAVLLGYIPNAATRRWAREQLRRTSLLNALSAIESVCDFNSDAWIREVAVPAAVVITTQDRIVPVSAQRKLAHAIPNASVYEVAADHGWCVNSPELFTHALLAACRDIVPNSTPWTAQLSSTGGDVSAAEQ
jgi:pimeloyl-ACP methyl ester carboxylesterase